MTSVSTLRSIRILLAFAALLGVAVMATACEEEIDVNTTEGLNKALDEGKKTQEAFDRLRSLASDPEALKPHGSSLAKLYLKDDIKASEALDFLTMIPSEDYKEVYIKAIKSGRVNEVRMAAAAVAEIELKEAAGPLRQAYQATSDDEIKEIVLQTGVEIEDQRLQDLAIELLEKDPGQAPIRNFRRACNLLEAQPTEKALPVLLKAVFYIDEAGRQITEDCRRAVLANGKSAIPLLLDMLNGRLDKVNNFIKRYPDRFSRMTVVLQSSILLGDLGAQEAVPELLKVLSDPEPIRPPTALSAADPNDPNTQQRWAAWAQEIGMVGQEIVLGINEIGAKGNEESVKTALMALYNWEAPYPEKFGEAIKYVPIIEVTLRVVAGRVLAEQNLLDQETVTKMLDVLTGPEWESSRVRPDARASIILDLVTYLAVASEPGWTETVHKFFAEMTNKELAGDKFAHFEPARNRIADVKSTFELGDRCADKIDCYLGVLKDDKATHHMRSKALYEIGQLGSAEHVPAIIEFLGTVDKSFFSSLGPQWAVETLARLGKAEHVKLIDALLEEQLPQKLGDPAVLKSVKGMFEPVKFTLKAKG